MGWGNPLILKVSGICRAKSGSVQALLNQMLSAELEKSKSSGAPEE